MNTLHNFKKTLITIGFVVLIASCGKKVEGSGNLITQERTVAQFTNIQADGSYNVVITQDTLQKVVVKTDDNIMGDVKTEVNGNTLRIYFANHHRNYNPTFMTVYISSSLIDDVNLSGSGSISSTNQLITPSPKYTISGSGNVNMSVQSQSVETNISGSGNIDLAGTAPTSQHTISGSGNISALGLASSNVTITISGSGDANVWADSTLNVTISGSGKVRYTGNPAVTTQISGSGNVAPY